MLTSSQKDQHIDEIFQVKRERDDSHEPKRKYKADSNSKQQFNLKDKQQIAHEQQPHIRSSSWRKMSRKDKIPILSTQEKNHSNTQSTYTTANRSSRMSYSFRSNKSIEKAVRRKIPHGTPFGYYYHMLSQKTPAGSTLIIKHYDTDMPEFVNFYCEYSYHLLYVKYYYKCHAIHTYKLNFLKAVADFPMQNRFLISHFNECLIPAQVGPDCYKIICFKNKMSSVNLVLELSNSSKRLPNIDFIFDAVLSIPELGLNIKLFEPLLVRSHVDRDKSAIVFNFLINKVKLKNIVSVRYSNIILHAHFNQSVICFPNCMYKNALSNFKRYRNELNNVDLKKMPIPVKLEEENESIFEDAFAAELRLIIENHLDETYLEEKENDHNDAWITHL